MDNINIYLQETGWEIVEWTHLAQDQGKWWAVFSTEMNLQVP
jgi:hypothetical protein